MRSRILRYKNWTKAFEALHWADAEKLKQEKSVCFLFEIEYNFAKVYLLNDWSFLVSPLDPHGNWLLTGKEEILNKWIREQKFPAGDVVDGVALEKWRSVDTLANCKNHLKEELCEYIFQGRKRWPDALTAFDIDSINEVLRQKNMYPFFNLHFILLLGDYLIARQKQLGLRWALLTTRQYLNPTVSLIIVSDQEEQRYFDLEKRLTGQRGYAGVKQYVKEMAITLASTTKDEKESIRFI